MCPVSEIYERVKSDRPDMSLAVAAVKALAESIQDDQSLTMSEFLANLESNAEQLRSTCKNPIAVQAGCDHYIRFATRMFTNDLEIMKKHLVEYGDLFFNKSIVRRDSIADFALKFITDDATILIHSYSRVVVNLLKKAAASNTRFKVFVTEARPTDLGQQAVQELTESNIQCKLILDAAVGYFMGKVDMVLVGAEGIAENGGLINQIGTYQIAVVAKAANKPFYVVTESHKFVRLFPLNQYDLCTPMPYNNHTRLSTMERRRARHINIDQGGEFEETVDYTPPQYITLLFTDMGINS